MRIETAKRVDSLYTKVNFTQHIDFQEKMSLTTFRYNFLKFQNPMAIIGYLPTNNIYNATIIHDIQSKLRFSVNYNQDALKIKLHDD